MFLYATRVLGVCTQAKCYLTHVYKKMASNSGFSFEPLRAKVTDVFFVFFILMSLGML